MKKNGGNKKRSVREDIKNEERSECEKHITWLFCATAAFKSHFCCGTTLNVHTHTRMHAHASFHALSHASFGCWVSAIHRPATVPLTLCWAELLPLHHPPTKNTTLLLTAGKKCCSDLCCKMALAVKKMAAALVKSAKKLWQHNSKCYK